MERPLFTPPLKAVLSDRPVEAQNEELDSEALFQQHTVDKTRLAACIRQALQGRAQVSLREVLEQHPLEQGLAELVTYLTLASEDREAFFDESTLDRIDWRDLQGAHRAAELPRVLFTR